MNAANHVFRACLALSLAGVVACGDGAVEHYDATLETAIAGDRGDRVEHAIRAERGERSEKAFVSWEEFSAQQSDFDRRFLRELDRAYFGAMSYESPEELAFLLRSGFPTPEEWLAARGMTDEQLMRQADNGDRKVAGILADRMVSQFSELLTLQQAQPELVSDSDRARAAAMAVNYAHAASRGSAGAFGIYVQGRVKATIFDTPEPLTAAMIEAQRRGDPRSQRLLSEMSVVHPKQDVSVIVAALENF